jgi:hypothetical protein
MKKSSWITLTVVIIVLAISIMIIYTRNNPVPGITEDLAKCIGSRSQLYVQTGCFHCVDQEKLFGDYLKYLNSTDCFLTPEKCADISLTPTWVINGQKYIGVQSIENLKVLTGC